MKQRTPAYVFTVDPKSPEDMKKVENLRALVKRANHANREIGEGTVLRVCLKARLGKNNPAAQLYRDKVDYWGNKGYFQSIKLEHAQRIDVYVQRRYP